MKDHVNSVLREVWQKEGKLRWRDQDYMINPAQQIRTHAPAQHVRRLVKCNDDFRHEEMRELHEA
jgi:hypothetical protein